MVPEELNKWELMLPHGDSKYLMKTCSGWTVKEWWKEWNLFLKFISQQPPDFAFKFHLSGGGETDEGKGRTKTSYHHSDVETRSVAPCVTGRGRRCSTQCSHLLPQVRKLRPDSNTVQENLRLGLNTGCAAFICPLKDPAFKGHSHIYLPSN